MFERKNGGYEFVKKWIWAVTYIRVTGNFNEISILNQSSFVGRLTQVNYGKSISFCLSRFWNTQCNFLIVYQIF